MSIELLLANDRGEQILGEGLPDDVAIPPLPEPEEVAILPFPRFDANPNDLAKQRWGIIAPAGEVGDHLLQVIAPLTAARKEQQEGHEPIVFRAPAGMSAEDAANWWATKYNDENINFRDRPRYLLLLGDANLISWEAQQRFSAGAFAGRLAFKTDSDYEAYIHKLLAYERAAAKSGNQKARAAFHTVRDGTAATSVGYRGLMVPSLDDAQTAFKDGQFEASAVVDLGEAGQLSPDDFLRAVSSREPTMLFTISHGLGIDPNETEKERQLLQGAMSFGTGQKITGADVINRPFLPGGAWFYFACFGAGTPSTSAYHHWLQGLKEAGLNIPQSQIEAVLGSLAREAPFVAALPQAALANPDGPLVVMSHVDLAWTFSFQDLGSKKYRTSPFQGIFQGVVAHSRLGASFDALQRVFNDATTDLTTMLDTEERAKRRNDVLPDAKTRALKKAGLWMLRQDVSAYVMLGDPAARIASSTTAEEVRSAPSIATTKTSTMVDAISAAGIGPESPTSGTATGSSEGGSSRETSGEGLDTLASMDPARIEAAVIKTVSNEALDTIAAQFGVPRTDLNDWVSTFLAGGRAAVAAKKVI